jgi:hypothetical protein
MVVIKNLGRHRGPPIRRVFNLSPSPSPPWPHHTTASPTSRAPSPPHRARHPICVGAFTVPPPRLLSRNGSTEPTGHLWPPAGVRLPHRLGRPSSTPRPYKRRSSSLASSRTTSPPSPCVRAGRAGAPPPAEDPPASISFSAASIAAPSPSVSSSYL